MRQTIRKSISLLLALCMILGLCLAAAREENQPTCPVWEEWRIPSGGAIQSIGRSRRSARGRGRGVWDPYHFVRLPLPVEEQQEYPAVTLTFQGTGIKVFGQLATNGPIMTVTIDGTQAGEADFYGSSASGIAYEKHGLDNGVHTAVFTFTNRTNSPDPSQFKISRRPSTTLRYWAPGISQRSVEGGTAPLRRKPRWASASP